MMKFRVIVPLIGILCACLFGSLKAAEIMGRVREVSDKTVTVAVEGDLLPNVGDKVQIFFKLAGADEEISVGSGTVLSTEGRDVKVTIDSASGEVAPEQLVRFTTSKTTQPIASPTATPPEMQPEPSTQPAASPTKTLPPSIPFPSVAPKSSAAPPPAPEVDPAAAQLLNKGIAQYSAGDIKGAIESYTSAIRIAPKLAVLYLNRANAYLYEPNFQKAVADANRALELKVEKAEDAYVVRGAARAGLGDYDAAIADCNRAIQINPKNALAYNNRANDKLRKGNYSGALADCNKAIALDPNLALAYYNRGYVYVNTGNSPGALADWRKAVSLQPGFGAELNPKIQQLEARGIRAR
jgi:Flp pilus assembly protein TadD